MRECWRSVSPLGEELLVLLTNRNDGREEEDRDEDPHELPLVAEGGQDETIFVAVHDLVPLAVCGDVFLVPSASHRDQAARCLLRHTPAVARVTS